MIQVNTGSFLCQNIATKTEGNCDEIRHTTFLDATFSEIRRFRNYDVFVQNEILSFTCNNWMPCNLCIRNQILAMKTSKESWERYLSYDVQIIAVIITFQT